MSIVKSLSLLAVLTSFGAKAQDIVILSDLSSKRTTPTEKLVELFNETSGKDWKVVVKKVSGSEMKSALKGVTSEDLKGDILYVTGAGNGDNPVIAKALQPLSEAVTNLKTVPSHLKHPDNLWTGYAKKHRTIYYNVDTLGDLPVPSSYADLAKPIYKGRLCLRHSDSEYNTSLVSYLFDLYGEKKGKALVEGWVANTVSYELSDSSGVLKALKQGKCAIGVANTYYFGHFLKKFSIPTDETKLRLVQPFEGAHVNAKAFGISATTTQKAKAEEFINWVLSPYAQGFYSSQAFLFPVNVQGQKSVYYPAFLSEVYPNHADVENTSYAIHKAGLNVDEVKSYLANIGWKTKKQIQEDAK